MATVYMNGFEWRSFYENILSWDGLNTGIVSASTTTGRGHTTQPRSGNYCLCIWGSDSFVRWQTTPLNEFYIQIAVKINSSYAESNLLRWTSPTPNILGCLTFNPTNQTMSVWTGDMSTRLGTSSTQLLYGKWYLIEIYVKLATSGGTIELRIDGQTQFTFTGATTPNDTTAALFYLVGNVKSSGSIYADGTHFWADDVVINDTTGDFNNSWPNGSQIVLLMPNGKGDITEWSRITGLDNYYDVAQLPVLDPSMYNYTEHTAMRDLYLLQDLPDDAYAVGAVRVDAWALKNSGSDIMLKLALLTAGLTFYSSDMELGISYNLSQWLHQLNPGTCAAWTVDDVKYLQGGINSNVPE